MSMFYEDFMAGAVFTTRARTVTESDISGFAGISGDFMELHTNEEFARQTRFGRRVAHGMLTLSITTGLTSQMDIIGEAFVAFYGIDELRFTRPVFIGDTIHVTKTVLSTQERQSDTGVVIFASTVCNQKQEVVMVFQDAYLLLRKPK